MKHPNLYKIEKYIILICIFSIPLHGIVTNYMRHNPALWNHFFHEYYHIFFYDYMSLAMIIAFGSLSVLYSIFAKIPVKLLTLKMQRAHIR